MSDFVRQNGTKIGFDRNSWCILSPIEQSIKRKIEAVGIPLKDWNISINYGIKTGCNEAFIIDGETKDALIAQDPKSAEIIRPFSLTLKYSDIPEFYNSRQQCAKESWETLFKFAKSKNEHRLLYSPTLKNRLKELRNFFRKFKDEDAFGIYQEIEYNQSRDGKICTQEVESRHRARGTKITYAKPLFELDVIEDDYNSNPRGRY